MASDDHTRFTLEDLEVLYRRLLARLDRLEGHVQQIRAERAGDTISRPTWRDFEELRRQVQRHGPRPGARRKRPARG